MALQLVVTPQDEADEVVARLQAEGEQAWKVGRIEPAADPRARVRFS